MASRIRCNAGVAAKNWTLTPIVARARVLTGRDPSAVALDGGLHEFLQFGACEIRGGIAQEEAAAIAVLHRIERRTQRRCLRGDALIPLQPVRGVGNRRVVMLMQKDNRNEHGEQDGNDAADQQPRGKRALLHRR